MEVMLLRAYILSRLVTFQVLHLIIQVAAAAYLLPLSLSMMQGIWHSSTVARP